MARPHAAVTARRRVIAPMTISSGGTYTGGVESTAVGTPAITISTTAAVTLDRMLIRHKGFGVFVQATANTNVTITNCVFQQTDPGSPTETRAVYLLQPASFTCDHNRFIDGHGVLIDGNNANTTTLRVRWNDFVDLGRFNSDTFIGAVHFNHVEAPNGAEVSWNRITNHKGRSVAEDVIGMTDTNGASGNPIDIHHNLINGVYHYTGDGAAHTGGGIDIGDLGGSWQNSHDNTLVRCTNNGLMIPAGSNLHHYNNRVVCGGIADNGERSSSTFGAGAMVWDNPDPNYPPITNADIHDNVSNQRRWNGTAWEFQHYYLPNCNPSTNCTGGTSGFGATNTVLSIGLTDSAAWEAETLDAIADWEAARVAAGHTVGPVAS